jgi:hypothetical protein
MGIDPDTLRLAAQCLNDYATPCPTRYYIQQQYIYVYVYIYIYIYLRSYMLEDFFHPFLKQRILIFNFNTLF